MLEGEVITNSDQDTYINKKLEESRKCLIDLSLRNKFLNYRINEKRTIKLTGVDSESLFKFFIDNDAQDNELIFKSDDEEQGSLLNELISETDEEYSENITKSLTISLAIGKEILLKRLLYLYQQSKAAFDDQGSSILYLAFGILKWREENSIQEYNSPLLLVPVELIREKKSSFKIIRSDDEILPNISLLQKMNEIGSSFSELFNIDEITSFDGIYQRIKTQISKNATWSLSDEVHLDLFSFAKFVMWKDLDLSNWPENNKPDKNSLIKQLYLRERHSNDIDFLSEKEIDKKIPYSKVFTTFDSDSSQQIVIEAIKNGKSLVVEGPPGTGKSQTIANVIVELMVMGKKILFVSEKMAALNVVKKRLDGVKLGQFCLELHSHKIKKSLVIQELKHAIKSDNSIDSTDPTSKIAELELTRDQLNNYVEALHEPFGTRKITPYFLFSLQEKNRQYFQKTGSKFIRLKFENTKTWSEFDYSQAIASLKDYISILSKFPPIDTNVWRDSEPKLLLPIEIEEIDEILSTINETLNNLIAIIPQIKEKYGLNDFSNVNKLLDAIQALEIIKESVPNEVNVLLNSKWDKPFVEISQIIGKVKKYSVQNGEISSIFLPDILKKSASETIDELSILNNKLILQEEDLNSKCKLLQSYYRIDIEFSHQKFIEDLKLVESVNSIFYPEPAFRHSIILLKDFSENIRLYREEKNQFDKIKNSILNYYNDISQSRSNKEILKDLRQTAEIKNKFDLNILSLEISELIDELEFYSRKRFRFFNREYRNKRRYVLNYYKKDVRLKDQTIISDLKEVQDFIIKLDPSILSINIQKIYQEFVNSIKKIITLVKNYRNIKEQILQLYRGFQNLTDDNIIENLREMKSIIENFNEYIFSEEALELKDQIFQSFDAYKEISQLFEEKYKPVLDNYRSPNEFNFESLIFDLKKIENLQNCSKQIRSFEQIGIDLFGKLWNNENSNPDDLTKFSNWIVKYRDFLNKGIIHERNAEIISYGVPVDSIDKEISDLSHFREIIEIKLKTFIELVNLNQSAVFSSSINELTFNQLFEQTSLWLKNISSLQSWSKYIQIRKESKKTKAIVILDAVERGDVSPDHVIPTFEINYADNLLQDVFRERPAIRDFIKESHENQIKKFSSLDNELIKVNRERAINSLLKNKPDMSPPIPIHSTEAILENQFIIKKGHLSIRKLLSKCGGLIQQFKPCFMMSPHSIAQFLEPGIIDFDVVIFDEASQITPEDALGSFLRGNQIVIMGDSKQLPPTNFFNISMESENNDENEVPITDVESILNLSKNAFPQKMLKWHYRSRHESLIAVSNYEFYENYLYIFPSSIKNSEELGLHHKYCPDTIYDKGKTRTNIQEARVVVQEVINHYRNRPDKSLMVGTFSTSQQDAIRDEFERERINHPEIESYLKNKEGEEFTIKNLETIQGDERDVVFISIGYGFDKEKILTLNFGPLNKEGGERRLNVLITRAREKCVVFSNFKSSHLQLGETSSFGVKVLRNFLYYAETGELKGDYDIGSGTESPFEDSVVNYLRVQNYELRTQVGCAGFRIDLALVDPKNPGNYLLGIECDGAQYHSSSVARDRDRLRQQILESLGWKIYRIWSTDWYRNPEDSQKALLTAIEKVLI